MQRKNGGVGMIWLVLEALVGKLRVSGWLESCIDMGYSQCLGFSEYHSWREQSSGVCKDKVALKDPISDGLLVRHFHKKFRRRAFGPSEFYASINQLAAELCICIKQ